MPVPRPPIPFRHPVTALLAGASVLLLLAVAARQIDRADQRAELVEIARDLAVDEPKLLREIGHAGDEARARLAVASALLAAELAPAEGLGDAERSRRRLETARSLAADVLDRRPTSWRAATVTGAATYLAWSRTRDPRVLQEYRRWEEPLLLAWRLAPGRDEPVRALVSAYVELWPALSDDKRRLARELAGRALRDRRTFDRLVEPWLQAAGSGPEALGAIPDEPWAWSRIAAIMATRSDWNGYCDAWRHRREALERSLRMTLEEARGQLDQGQVLAARRSLLGLVATVPPEPHFVPVVDAALRAAPPGPPRPELLPALREWLRWQLSPTESAGDGLSPEALARLRSASFPGHVDTDDLPLAARATLALESADAVQRAERIERRADDLWSDSWGLYFIEKAAALVRADDRAGARVSLDRVAPGWRDHPRFLEVSAEAVGSAQTDEREQLRTALDRQRASRWPGTAWTWSGPTPSLRLLTAGPADGLRIAIAEAPATGAAVEVRLDGRGTGCRAIGPGETIELTQPIAPGPHALELRTLAGNRVWPGGVELVPGTAGR